MSYTEQERVANRLQLIEKLLAERIVADWDSQRLNARKKSLFYLREYWKRGVFPINTMTEFRIPIFVDTNGNPCAAAFIMQRHGFEKAVERIHKTQNNNYLEQISDKDFKKFLSVSGLELEELKLIQPSYSRGSYAPKSYKEIELILWSLIAEQRRAKIFINNIDTKLTTPAVLTLSDYGIDSMDKNPKFTIRLEVPNLEERIEFSSDLNETANKVFETGPISSIQRTNSYIDTPKTANPTLGSKEASKGKMITSFIVKFRHPKEQ